MFVPANLQPATTQAIFLSSAQHLPRPPCSLLTSHFSHLTSYLLVTSACAPRPIYSSHPAPRTPPRAPRSPAPPPSPSGAASRAPRLPARPPAQNSGRT